MQKVTRDNEVLMPDVAIANNGKALAVWPEEINGTLRLVAVEGDSETGEWGSKEFLDDGFGLFAPGTRDVHAQVVMDASGNGTIGWTQGVTGSDAVHLKTITYSESGFGVPVDHGESDSFALATNDAGDTFIVWESEYAPGKRDLIVSEKLASEAAWGQPQNLTGGLATNDHVKSFALEQAKIQVNEKREAMLFYYGAGSNIEGTTEKLQALNRDAEGVWTRPETILEGSEMADMTGFVAAMTSSEKRFFGWVSQVDTNHYEVRGVTHEEGAASNVLAYGASDVPLIHLSAHYRDDGTLLFAAQGKEDNATFPLMTIEVEGDDVVHDLYESGGRHLVVAGNEDRVVSAGVTGCNANYGVRESLTTGQELSEIKCAGGSVRKDAVLAITPDRAGLLAGVGSQVDESVWPAQRYDMIELTFFK